MSDDRAFPLHWPEGWTRTPFERRGYSRFKTTLDKAREELELEVSRLGGRHMVVSTDMPLRRDGKPMAGRAEPRDPGVAVYFQWRGRAYAIACDSYRRLHENMRALGKTIEAVRTIERHGASQLLERAVSGFRALGAGEGDDPEPTRPWWEVLGVTEVGGVRAQEVANDPEHALRKPLLAFIEAQYKAKISFHHPDKSPEDAQKATELNLARAAARKALG